METITVQKQVFENFALDLEKLLADFEHVLDTALETETNRRLQELQTGSVKPFTETDYQNFLKKKGIKNA